jgi:hypothetical protein
MLRGDLEVAGVPHVVAGPDGPLFADFHALRHSYLALGGRAGIDLRTLEELAGHSTPDLTPAIRTADCTTSRGPSKNSRASCRPKLPNPKRSPPRAPMATFVCAFVDAGRDLCGLAETGQVEGYRNEAGPQPPHLQLVGDRTQTGDSQIHSLPAARRKSKPNKDVATSPETPLAFSLAHESQRSPQTAPSTAAPLDPPGAVAALAPLPVADRRAHLDALAVALSSWPGRAPDAGNSAFCDGARGGRQRSRPVDFRAARSPLPQDLTAGVRAA